MAASPTLSSASSASSILVSSSPFSSFEVSFLGSLKSCPKEVAKEVTGPFGGRMPEALAVTLLALLGSSDEVRPSIPSPTGFFAAVGACSPGLNAVAGVEDWPGERPLLASAGEIFRLGLVRLRRSVLVGESG